EKAIDMALQNNDKVLQYKEKLIQKKYEKRSARGNLLPSVSFSAGYTHLDNPFTIDLEPIRQAMISLQAKNQVSLASMSSQIKGGPAIDNPSTPTYQSIYQKAYSAFDQALPNFIDTLKEQNYPSAVITAVQPLFTGGKIRAGIRAAEIEKTTTSYELKKIEQDVVMETADYYIACVLMRDIIKVRQDVLSAMEIHRERAQKLYAQGIIAKYHLLRAEVAVSEANRNLYFDQNRYEVAKIALRKCINSETDFSDPVDSLVYHPIEDTLDEFLITSEKGQPVISIIKCKKDLANQKVAVQKSAFLPNVAAFGKFELFSDYLSALEPQWAAGVMLNLTIFNGFKNINNLQSSKHLINELEKLESGIKDDIRLWINKAYRDMRSNEKQFLLLESDIKLADENLRQCKSRFENGYGTSLEVIDAQLVLEKNRIDRLLTLHDYYKSYIDLSTVTGTQEQIIRIFR
ncbi:MAG TPA: TolC family protein, partial [Bacteroidales bacterium]|nr:TolC family protein [Bacteroidales bacterium]